MCIPTFVESLVGVHQQSVPPGLHRLLDAECTRSPIFFNASGVGLSPLNCDHFWPIVPAPDEVMR
jgi:hypothetical protein